MTGARDQVRWRASRRAAAGQARPLYGYPPVLLAAGVLAAGDVASVLVGSAALWLRGESIPVGDHDLVIEPDEQNLRRLHVALARMALRPGSIPLVSSFQRLALLTVITSADHSPSCTKSAGRLVLATDNGAVQLIFAACQDMRICA
jgi:hypothetical protein